MTTPEVPGVRTPDDYLETVRKYLEENRDKVQNLVVMVMGDCTLPLPVKIPNINPIHEDGHTVVGILLQKGQGGARAMACFTDSMIAVCDRESPEALDMAFALHAKRKGIGTEPEPERIRLFIPGETRGN